MAFSGGMKLLDMMPLGYDMDYINTLFETLGEKGRDIYLYNQIPVDMIYLTTWVNKDGTIQFRDDIYGYDKLQLATVK